ncbi:MAG: phosphate ABC transporter ATP-binding protein PstB [Methermicoccaceae archaeon]
MFAMDIKNLSIWYGERQAIADVSMPVHKNSITTFIGPSGCGKSTFLRALNRMNDLIEGCRTEGKVLFEGQDIYRSDVDVVELRTRVGMVFQKPTPFPMSIYDNIAYGPKIHGEKRKAALDKIVEESLKKAALWGEIKDRLTASAMSLSGGQQQRLCIARALAINPEVILFDEPSSAIDPISTAKIEELMLKLKKDYTVVVVTHNMQQAARIGDYTGFFLMGKIIEFSRTREVFETPQDVRTEDYITGRFG